jgi:hypothetical protein
MPEGTVDQTPYTPTYSEEATQATITENNQVANKEFDSILFINCGGIIGQITVNQFNVGECN